MTLRRPRDFRQFRVAGMPYAHAQLDPDPLTAATLDLGTVTTNVDTVIAAAEAGADGNSTTIAFVADGTGAGTLDESAFPDIVFHFENGVTTVANFETAVGASTNLVVDTAGTGGNLLATGDDEFAAENLTGGLDAEVITAKIWKLGKRYRIDRVSYINPTGLAESATDYIDISLRSGATVIASWSTADSAEGTLTADTFVELTLSATDANLVLDVDDELVFHTVPTGDVTLPAGTLLIEGRYV